VLAPVLILSILPTPMWIVCKTAWGLKNDLTGDQSAALSRTFHRLFDGSSPQHILSVLTTRATAIWMLMALVLVISFFAVHEREKLHRGALVAIGSAALYFCGLCVAYLSTPYALDFHLSTSATRTMTIASVSLFVAMFFLLSGLELHKDPAHEGTRAERTVNATAAGC
jgi:preprotein translocase subunit SecG